VCNLIESAAEKFGVEDKATYEEESPYENLKRDEVEGFKKICQEIIDKYKSAELSEDQTALDAAINAASIWRKELNDQGVICTFDLENGKFHMKSKAKLKKEHDKVRQLLKNQIANAIKKIDKEMPKLARHLRMSIKVKSQYTIYSPENPTPWYIRF
jgi:hypothetical protein